MMGWHWSWWAWTVMTLAMLAGWGALFWLIAGLGHDRRGQVVDDPERTLADRLARGDIQVEEYQRRVDALRQGTGAGGR